MILIEQDIDVNILHLNSLQHFRIIEMLTVDGDLNFKVMKDGDYYYTLVGENLNNTFSLTLSALDIELDFDIDRQMLSKIKAAIYSVFLNEKAS